MTDLKQKLAEIRARAKFVKSTLRSGGLENEDPNFEFHDTCLALLAVIDKLIEQRDNASACYYERLYGEAIEGKTEMDRDKQGEDAELLEILERGK